MPTANLICRNCSQSVSHMFRDCQNMHCTCPCVNQIRGMHGNDGLRCTCGYMNRVHQVRAGRFPKFFSENCLCLKPADHLPDFIRNVPKRKRGK